MTSQQKTEIRLLTIDFVAKQASQNKAAEKLIGVSSATLSQVINEKWGLISNEMWIRLGKQVGFAAPEWVFAETKISKKIFTHLELAKNGVITNITGIVSPAGSGKSETAEQFAALNPETILVQMKKGDSLRNLYKKMLKAMGISSDGLVLNRMETVIYGHVLKSSTPLIIIDEIDKARPEVWMELICMYNEFKGKCNIATLSTSAFETKIVNGVNAGRLGYDEIHSRFGGSFVDVGGADSYDLAAVIMANGITDQTLISKVIDQSKRLERYDIRVGSDIVRVLKNKAA